MHERGESALLISGALCALNPAGGHYSISSHVRNADRLLNPPITDHCFMNSPLLSSLPPSLLSNAPCCLSFSRLCLNCSAPSLLSLPRFAAPPLFSSSSSSSTLLPSSHLGLPSLRGSFSRFPTDWLTHPQSSFTLNDSLLSPHDLQHSHSEKHCDTYKQRRWWEAGEQRER